MRGRVWAYGEADFHGDALAGDVLGEVVDVFSRVGDGGSSIMSFAKSRYLADAVGVAFRDRLEDDSGRRPRRRGRSCG